MPMLSSPSAFILPMEFDAQHAVAEIDQRCARVLLNHATRAFNAGERDNPRTRLQGLVALRQKIENTRFAASPGHRHAGTARSPRARACPWRFAAIRGGRVQPGHDIQEAQGIPELERPQFVGVSPTHGAIDLDDPIRDFGESVRRNREQVAKTLPQEAARAVSERTRVRRRSPRSSISRVASTDAKRGFAAGWYSSVFQSSAWISLLSPLPTRL